MILVMKITSIAYDVKIGRLTTTPSFFAHCGYLLCPANSIFGPWITYKQYLSIFYKPIWVIISTLKYCILYNIQKYIKTLFLRTGF